MSDTMKTESYDWPRCCENGCIALADTIHVSREFNMLQEDEWPPIDPDPAAFFFCQRHGLSSSEHRYWLHITPKRHEGYTLRQHIEETKRWGPQFLAWLDKNWPAVQFAK